MRKLLSVLLKYFLFWIIYFLLSKVFFLLFNSALTGNLTFSEIEGIFFHGIRMDFSAASYLMLLPGVILSFSYLLSPKALGLFFKVYTIFLLIIVTIINVLDLGLYPHWGTRVGITAFNYVGDPKGVIANLVWTDVVLAVVISLFFILSFLWLYNRYIKNSVEKAAKQKWYLFPVMLFITALLIIPIRGGLRTSPMNLSTVSFSEKLYVNHSSYNFMWHFFQTVERNKANNNPCVYMEKDVAWETFQSVENKRVGSDSIFIELNEDKLPNVLLIILESFSNKIISSFGGEYDACPNLDLICDEAVIFPSFYASGNRSDRGMSAILGGYPSLLSMSIMRYPDKSDKLTLMSDYFNRKNYNSSFYYGGDINFYNLKPFVLQGEYDEIVTMDKFPKEQQDMSNWGVPDGFLFDRLLNDLNKHDSPFFSVAYTLSSHPPYDVPVQMIEGNSNEAKYLNSVAYTDSCLGSFIREFKKTKYWQNTLVVITADHGSVEPGPTEIIDPATYRIPLIWTGGVIKKPGLINNIGGQPDLIPTLLGQLGWENDSVMFGHDIFSYPEYAFYMHDSGWGYVVENGEFFYNKNSGEFKVFNENENIQPELNFAKSYMQVLHDDFLIK